jgi:hypothetical protein
MKTMKTMKTMNFGFANRTGLTLREELYIQKQTKVNPYNVMKIIEVESKDNLKKESKGNKLKGNKLKRNKLKGNKLKGDG